MFEVRYEADGRAGRRFFAVAEGDTIDMRHLPGQVRIVGHHGTGEDAWHEAVFRNQEARRVAAEAASQG